MWGLGCEVAFAGGGKTVLCLQKQCSSVSEQHTQLSGSRHAFRPTALALCQLANLLPLLWARAQSPGKVGLSVSLSTVVPR